MLDSRPVDEGTSIKRRRECPTCGKRFTTYEVIDTVPIAVVKRDGRREFFDKHKLLLGIERACQKRPVSAEAVASSIESDLQNAIVTEVSSRELGEMVLSKLKEMDIVSYIRLWAVGLAGAAISATVNELAGPLFGNFMFMIIAIVLLVFGHGLNMILNVLSVIVHGIRLNTLEFSSHLDMSWSGHKFKPFEE